MFKKIWFWLKCFKAGYCAKHDWNYFELGSCQGCLKDNLEARKARDARLKHEYETSNGK